MKTESAGPVIQRADAYYFQGRCDDAIMLLADFIARTPIHEDAAIRAAELLIDSERYAQALEFLNNLNVAEPNPCASYLLGFCHQALGDLDAAERIADGMIAQKGRGALALVLKARIASFHRRTLVVEELLAEAVGCDPGCGIAWHDYAGLRRQKGDLQEYFNFAKKAFACAPESREISRAFHESSLAAQRLPEAETAFLEALSERRMNRRIRYFLIDLLLRQNKNAEAMAAVESAIVDFGADQGILGAALQIRDRLGPMSLPPAPKPGGSVSLCTIVKNEKNHLARCLVSAKPFVDEIIVVDTGSTDETKDIARVFGARIYEIEWVDDFSKARNFALSKASGDWILVLDADETLSSGDCEEFRRILEASRSRPTAFRMQTRNYSNLVNIVGFRPNRGEYPEEEGLGWYPSDKVRLFPNDPRIHFNYPVHELVEPSLSDLKISVRDCPIVVHHYGVLNEIHAREKTSNYHTLGRKKIKNFRDSIALKEAAIQSARVGKHAESLDLWRRFIKQHPRSAEAYLNMGAVCSSMGRHKEAAANAQKALDLDPELKEARFNLSFSLLMRGQAEKAQTLLEALYKEHPDYAAAQFLLCVAYACRQDSAPAESLFKKLRALPIGEHIGESFLDIARRFLEASRRDYARHTLETALIFGCVNPEIRTLLESGRAAA
jgi:glycosyltransferase involved in cell wall biosynthesis